MDLILLIPVLISLILVIFFLPKWIKKCHFTGLLWEDMNKFSHPKNVASSGGIMVIISFVLGVLLYVSFRTFIFQNIESNLEIFSLLTSILILGIIGLTDDLLGWKNNGLSKRFRLFLILFASIPLVVINAGVHKINLPILGNIDLGIWYPLFLIPLGIMGATATYNFLAGFNGLETSQGILIIGFLSYISYITGTAWLAVVGLCMVAALLGFYIFNKFPALVFPGDVLTYPIGGFIAIMAILGNFEKIAAFVFIPYIIETGLKLRGGLKKHSFAIPNPDGSLELPYKKIYSLTHLSILILKKFKNKVYEKDVVYLINLFQIIIILLSLLLFKQFIYT